MIEKCDLGHHNILYEKTFRLVLGSIKAKLLIYILGLNVFLWSSTYNCKFIVLIRSYRSPRICTSLSGFLVTVFS